MFGIPLEIISMGASALGGFWLTHSANQAERLHEERLAYNNSVRAAREDSAGVWVRRFIVLVMMSLLAFIVVGPAFIDVNTVIVEDHWYGKSKLVIEGIMYDETMRMIITSIVGYYFGTSSAGR